MDKKTEEKIFEEKIPEKVRTYQETKKAKMKILQATASFLKTSAQATQP